MTKRLSKIALAAFVGLAMAVKERKMISKLKQARRCCCWR